MEPHETADPPRRRLQILLPEGIREEKTVPIDMQDQAAVELLRFCAETFGGATSYGRGVGAWRDEEAPGAPILWDRITVIEVWIDPSLPDRDERLDRLGQKLRELCARLSQKAIGCTLDGRWKVYRQEQVP